MLISLLLLTNIVYSSVNVYMLFLTLLLFVTIKNRSFETIAALTASYAIHGTFN